MNDPAVARLKERMYELGYFSNRTVNDTFTKTTAEYVKEFQRVNGLPADGIATPEMQALFFSDYAIPKPEPTPKPQTPTNLKVSTSSGVPVLTWSKVDGAIGYIIYRTVFDDSSFYQYATTTTNSFTDAETARGMTYYYKVVSVFENSISSEMSKSVKAVMPKPTPTPYIEPKYPLEIGNYAYWNYYSDYISFNPQG